MKFDGAISATDVYTPRDRVIEITETIATKHATKDPATFSGA